MENLYTLVYISAGTHLFSDQELDSLLAKSRENNSKINITGILLYSEGNFIQAIEGTKEDIDYLFNKISLDPRHKYIIKLYQKPITERMFSEWSMAFKKSDKSSFANIPGLSDFMETNTVSDVLKNNSSAVSQLLLSFKKNN